MYIELPSDLWTSRPYHCIEVSKFFLVLNEAMNLPDGFFAGETVSDEPSWRDADDGQWVILKFHRVEDSGAGLTGHLSRAMAVASKKVDRELDVESAGSEKIGTATTVVEAVTPAYEPAVRYSVKLYEDVRSILPSRDPLNRCIRLIRDYSRASIVAFERVTSPVSYDTVFPFVSAAYGWAEIFPTVISGQDAKAVRMFDESFRVSQLIKLEHFNFPGFAALDVVAAGERVETLQYWIEQMRCGSPFFRWREVLLAAKKALHYSGDYTTACVMAQTAGEILLDGILCVLMWEEGVTPESARKVFDEKNELLSRVMGELAPRLKGNWSHKTAGVFETWYEKTSKIRHRVVHAGYDPAYREAFDAYSATLGLMTYCMDRLADRRNKYPRSAFMTMAQSGLQARGVWSGKIKNFIEVHASTEPSWRDSFADWRQVFSAS